MLGKTIKPVPNIVVASAPKYNCPSAPIFQNFALKAIEAAKRNMIQIELNGDTIYREARLKHGATQVYMKPAAPGTGIIAGGAMRALFEVLGIKNILAKSLYSRNSINVVRATLRALQEMESPEYVADKRGIPLGQLMGEIDG